MTEPAVAPAPAAATAPAPDPTTPQPAAPVVDWQAEAEKWKHLSRQNEAQAKANADAAAKAAAHEDALAKVAQALGLKEAAPDPAAISAKLAAAEKEARNRATELAVLRAAGSLNADGDALLDSRAFLASIGEIDPANLDAVKAAVATAVTANPKFAKTPPAPAAPPRQASTSGDFNGAPGGQRQWTAEDVARATPAQVSKALKDGLLRDYQNS